MTDALIGTWRLQSHRLVNQSTGSIVEPFGPKPGGVLMFDADGYMTALITGDPAAGAGTMPLLAYAGRWRIVADQIVTAVEVAWLAAWVGTEQARGFRLDGDRLELITPPAAMPGDAAIQIATLTWVREPAADGAARPAG